MNNTHESSFNNEKGTGNLAHFDKNNYSFQNTCSKLTKKLLKIPQKTLAYSKSTMETLKEIFEICSELTMTTPERQH